jgi:hypothetical protein
LEDDTYPPAGDTYLFEMWQERGWLSNGRLIIWSQVGAPEMYHPDDLVEIEPGQGQLITSLLAWQDRLLVAKRNRIFFIQQTGPNSWNRDTLSDTHGIPSPHGAVTLEGVLFFFGGDNFYRSDGGAPYAISNTEIRNTLDAIPQEQQVYVQVSVYPRRSWLICSVPQNDGERVALVHNYKTGAWTKFRHWDNVHWIDRLNTPFGESAPLCVTQDGHAYDYDKGLVDRPGRPDEQTDYEEHRITCRLRSGAFATGADVRMWMRRFRMLCDTVGHYITATLFSDEKPDPANQRQLPLHRGQLGGRGIARRWKLFNFNSPLLGYTHQLQIEYDGRDPLQVEGIGVEFNQREGYRQVAQ